MAITAGQIYALAASFAQDSGYNTNTEAEYLSAAQEAQNRLAEILKDSVKTDTTIDTVGGTQYYSLPLDYMAMYDTYSSGYGPVAYTDANGVINYPVFTTFQGVRNMFQTDLYTKTGTPEYCWADVQHRLWFYPTPDYSGTNNVTVEYYNYPTTFSLSSTTCDYPNKYLHTLAYLTAEIMAGINELDKDQQKFHTLALLRLNSVSTAGDNIDTNKNSSKIHYLG